jgi:hypothetical protein
MAHVITTVTMTCRQILREGSLVSGSGGGHGELRCVAEADESGYCPVHRNPRPRLVPSPTPRPKRDLNADVLPWDEHDRVVFSEQSRRSVKKPMRR